MTQEGPKVTIIIPHYNQKECLQRLLPSVTDQTFKDFEVIIIDDRTPDEATVSFMQEFIKDKPNMYLVRNTENMRFIKTCNKGIKLAKGEYVCLLNSDTEIKRTFVEKNVTIMDADPTIGGLSCVVIDQRGRNWFSGGRYRHGSHHNLTDDFEGIRLADYVAGTAAFYRREVFDKIGLFNANLIMYYEDVEFGLRMRQQTAYRLAVFSDKLVMHFLVPSIPRSELCYHLNRNRILLCKEYASKYLPEVMARIFAREVAARLVLAPLALLALRPSLSSRWIRFASASMRGMLHGTMSRIGPTSQLDDAESLNR
jgi:GT2 family glycosyltransferase